MRRAAPITRHAADRRGRLHARLGARRLAVAGPVHRALHDVQAAPAGVELRPRFATYHARPPTRRRPTGSPSGAAVAARGRARTGARSQRGRGDRPHRVPRHRAEHDRGQRHRPRHAEEGPGPRPAHVHAGRGPARLHRRAPDDVPGAVLAHRQLRARRPDHARDAVRDVHLRDHAATGSSTADDLSRPALARDTRVVALQACHPRFFATHRYIAYARLVRVEPRDGGAVRRRAAPSPRAAGSAHARRRRARRRRAGRARARRPRRRGRSCATPGPATGSSTTPSSGRRRAGAEELVARRRCVARRRARVPCRTARAGIGRALEGEHVRAGRRARSRRATRPGCPAARTRASARATPNETGLPGWTATRQNTSSTPSSASIRRTRSCGPTETPPDVTSTSARGPCSSASR